MAVQNENYVEMSDRSSVQKNDTSKNNSEITSPTEQDNLIVAAPENDFKNLKPQKPYFIDASKQDTHSMPPKPGWKGMNNFYKCCVLILSVISRSFSH